MSLNPFAQALLEPKSIALVGASSDVKKNTARPLRFMRKHGYTGRIFPINPSHAQVLGEPAFPDLGSLPEPVDHVFVMVPGERVAQVLPDCARAGAKVVTIYSDGFGEKDEAGRQRQERLVADARALGLRLLGPNSIGLANAHSGAVLSVNAVFEADNLLKGTTSMVSQSGSMMGSLLSRAAARGFGFAKSVSVGNESDITVGEIVDALVDDPQTEVILLFLETIRNAEQLSRALARAYDAGKPVVAYRLGRSAQADALSQSHTGAIAGNDAAIDAFFKAHGVVRVSMLETLFEIVPLLQRYGRQAAGLRTPRVAVLTTTGGGAATVVDNLGIQGVDVVTPPDEFVEHMAGRGLKIKQAPVIDLTLAATSAQYKDLLEQLLQAPWCDAVLSVVGSSAQFHPELAVRPLVEAQKPEDKPLVAFLAPEAMESLRVLQKAGIAAFRTPESCADALSNLLRRREPRVGRQGAAALAWPDGLPRTGLLSEFEAGRLLEALGVRRPHTVLLRPGEACPSDLQYPVVAKICSRDIPHKTEVGGVRIGIRTEGELTAAVGELLESVGAKRPDAHIDGVLVQTMQSRLLELIVGYRRDPVAGPTIMLGAGGIAAELMKDFSVRTAPVDESVAREMIEEVAMTQLIRGYRGLPRGDCDALARLIVSLSQLAKVEGVTVEEAEINPVFVSADSAVAVDALVRLA
jgi:acyl-CoA synthetase (NDP forming)